MSEGDDNEPNLRLVQHDVAYSVQLYLRIISAQYTLSNTTYTRLESGQSSYPLLIDTNSPTTYMIPSPIKGGGGGHDYLTQTKQKSTLALEPTSIENSDEDALLSHLRTTHTDLALPPHTLHSLTLIRSTLNPLLLALTFADKRGFEGYQRRYLNAASYADTDEKARSYSLTNFVYTIAATIKMAGERISVLQSLREPGGCGGGVIVMNARTIMNIGGAGPPLFPFTQPGDVCVSVAIKKCVLAYKELESMLRLEKESQQCGYDDFGFSRELTVCHVVLFEYICNALTNPHLVNVILTYTSIMDFFVECYEQYFADGACDRRYADADCVNERNQFCQLKESYVLAKATLSKMDDGRGTYSASTVESLIVDAVKRENKVKGVGKHLQQLVRGGVGTEKVSGGGGGGAGDKQNQRPSSTPAPPPSSPQQQSQSPKSSQAKAMDQIRENENKLWLQGVTIVCVGFFWYSNVISFGK